MALLESSNLSLFHGTCTGHLASIRQHGLQGRQTVPKGGASRRGVYLTDDYEQARAYGDLACDLQHHNEHGILIVAVHSALLDPSLFQPDDYDLQDAIQGGEQPGSEPIDPRLRAYTRWDQVSWQLSLAITRQVFYAGSIPPEALSIAET